jgi:aspartyl-tRNA(Asn)/glutamyl-tRNA(Gln) amidotransferase subunit A
LAALEASIEGAKLAVPAGMLRGEITSEVAANLEAAIGIFRSLGADIVEIPLPESFFACVEAMTKIISVEGYAEHGAWIEAHADIDPFVRGRLSLGKGISRSDYLGALQLRKKASTAFCDLLSGFDALLTPTTTMPAVALRAVDESVAPLNRLTRPVNYFDLCAIAIPSGFTTAGLPLSLQIIGKPLNEIEILRLALAFQRKIGRLDNRRPILPEIS